MTFYYNFAIVLALQKGYALMPKFLIRTLLVFSVCFAFAENLQSNSFFANFTPTERAILKPDELKGFHFYSQKEKKSYKNNVFILCFHTFLGTGTSSLDFSHDEMRDIINQITDLGYTFVKLEDAVKGAIRGKNNVVITIDDGNHSVYNAFFEVFKPLGIKPDLFIPPALIYHEKFYMKWDQLRTLQTEGCGIMAHGYSHRYVTPHAYKNNKRDALREIQKPAQYLTKELQTWSNFMGYPYGVSATEIRVLTKEEGYTWAFNANEKIVPVNFEDPQLDHYAVPRTIIYRWNLKSVLQALKEHAKNPF